MSTQNPEFLNIERAPYELVKLVAKLGVTRIDKPLSVAQCQVAEAIEQHAANATDTILSGIEAIGRAISCASVNPQWQLSSTTMNHLGCLITHLAVEAQVLHDTSADIRSDLARTTRGARA